MEVIGAVISKFGFSKLLITSALLFTAATFFFYVIVSKPDMALLYGDLNLSDSRRILSTLDSMGIPSDVRGGGTQVYVPSNDVGNLRMILAKAGIPNGGPVGYEIFDRSEAPETTDFIHDINRLRALEGELARTIQTLSKVAAARVHLVLPQRDPSSRETQEPTASIVLKLGKTEKIDSKQVNSIQQLVAAAVLGLKPDNVSIIDDRGNLLTRGEPERIETASADLNRMRFEYERRLASSLETLIGHVVGPGKVHAKVAAEIDSDQLTENTEMFAPEGRVGNSIQSIDKDEIVNEDPSIKDIWARTNKLEKNTSNRGNINNYEGTLRTHIHESRGIKKLSVALLVDGAYTTSAEGKEEYVPRTEKELRNIEKLVKSAIGYRKERGDLVEVVNMRFASPNISRKSIQNNSIMGFEKYQLLRLGTVLIITIFAFLTLFFILKPLLNKAIGGSAKHGDMDKDKTLQMTNGKKEFHSDGKLAESQTSPSNENVQRLQVPQTSKLNEMVRLKSIKGEIHASSLKAIGDLIEQHPEESVDVVRGWLKEGSNA